MALKILLPLLALIGQIASQDQEDYDPYRSQDNLDELPVLPGEGEDKSALLNPFNRPKLIRPRPPPPPPPPPYCRCPFGFSMCAKNPYDQNEVGCIVYCYRTYLPGLDINQYRWTCPAYPPPSPFGLPPFPLAGQDPKAVPISQPFGDSVPHADAPPLLPGPY